MEPFTKDEMLAAIDKVRERIAQSQETPVAFMLFVLNGNGDYFGGSSANCSEGALRDPQGRNINAKDAMFDFIEEHRNRVTFKGPVIGSVRDGCYFFDL